MEDEWRQETLYSEPQTSIVRCLCRGCFYNMAKEGIFDCKLKQVEINAYGICSMYFNKEREEA